MLVVQMGDENLEYQAAAVEEFDLTLGGGYLDGEGRKVVTTESVVSRTLFVDFFAFDVTI